MCNNYNKIKVVIASKNREASLLNTLKSIIKNDIPPTVNVEIIIIENEYKSSLEAKTDDLKLPEKVSLNYNFINQVGKSKALNYGIKNYCNNKNDFILFTDDDVIVGDNWIKNYYKAINTYGKNYFYGGGVTIPNDVVLEKPYYKRCLLQSQRGIEDPKTNQNYDSVFIGPNWGCFFEHIEESGYYEESLGPGTSICLGEETYLQEKIKKLGINPYFIKNNSVIHCLQSKTIDSKEVLNKRYMIGRRRVLCKLERDLLIVYFLKVLKLYIKILVYSFSSEKKFKIKCSLSYHKGIIIQKLKRLISKIF